MNTDHLAVLQNLLSNERARLAASKTSAERELRTVWVAQAERELAAEFAFLGMPTSEDLSKIDDDELLAELLDNT